MKRKNNIPEKSGVGEQHQFQFTLLSEQQTKQDKDTQKHITGSFCPEEKSCPISNIIAGNTGKAVVRQKECKTILNRTSISDYSLNCYTGCTHGCIYCYARFMTRFHPHPEQWGNFVDVKVNAVEALKRQLRHAQAGKVFVSSACDGWQPLEAEWKLTRQCCKLLLEHGFHVNILTKSELVLRDFDIFSGQKAKIGVTVTTLDENLRLLWEPNCSSTQQRFDIVEKAHRSGLKTAVMFGPLLPFLSDSQASINSMFQRAADLAVNTIWVDALNLRPRVWPSVARLLRKEFPDLFDRCRQILFDQKKREEYLKQVRIRVACGARRFSLTNRVSTCL